MNYIAIKTIGDGKMKKIILLFALLFLIRLQAQEFLIYSIEDVIQLNIAKFNKELNEAIKTHEAVIVLLPKFGGGVYKKTLTVINKEDIPELLTYCLRIKKTEIAVNHEVFTKKISEVLEELKNKYGPSFTYSINSKSSYKITKKSVENPDYTKRENRYPIIIPKNEYTIWDALGKTLIISIFFIIIIFGSSRYWKYRKATKKLTEENEQVRRINDFDTILSNNLEKEKKSFFDYKDNILNCILIIFMIISSSNFVIAQDNIFIDNTIKKISRDYTKNLILKTITLNPSSSYYLFGDSVRYIGKINAYKGGIDSIISKITFKDKNTSFSSLLNYTRKIRGVHLIITDGKPDYFGEDIPDIKKVNSKNNISFSTESTSRNLSNKVTVWEKTHKILYNKIFLIGLVSGSIIVFSIAVLIGNKKRKIIAKPELISIIYKGLNGKEKTFLSKKIMISGNLKDNFFVDQNFDSTVLNLGIYLDDRNIIIEETKKY